MHFYQFGPFRLDPINSTLHRGDDLVLLTPKAFKTLLVLVQHSPHLVGKEELIREVWPDTFVEEIGLNRNISVIRKALGEATGENKYIETVPRQGYRFVVPIEKVEQETERIGWETTHSLYRSAEEMREKDGDKAERQVKIDAVAELNFPSPVASHSTWQYLLSRVSLTAWISILAISVIASLGLAVFWLRPNPSQAAPRFIPLTSFPGGLPGSVSQPALSPSGR